MRFLLASVLLIAAGSAAAEELLPSGLGDGTLFGITMGQSIPHGSAITLQLDSPCRLSGTKPVDHPIFDTMTVIATPDERVVLSLRLIAEAADDDEIDALVAALDSADGVTSLVVDGPAPLGGLAWSLKDATSRITLSDFFGFELRIELSDRHPKDTASEAACE